MDNNQRLEFLLKLERRDKRRKLVKIILAGVLIGAVLIFAQYMNFESVKH